jgi:hypothetical protein
MNADQAGKNITTFNYFILLRGEIILNVNYFFNGAYECCAFQGLMNFLHSRVLNGTRCKRAPAMGMCRHCGLDPESLE